MNLVRKISITLLCIFLVGCSTPRVVCKTEYQQVQVPIVVPIERPNRPVYTYKDSVPTYLLKVLEYTSILEVLIDEHNKSKDNI